MKRWCKKHVEYVHVDGTNTLTHAHVFCVISSVVATQRDAPELRCGADGKLIGATYSDHGHVIIGGVFSPQTDDESRGTSRAVAEAGGAQPGRVTVDRASGLTHQSEHEYAGECARREANGHDSGMGEIFRRAAAVSPIKPLPVRRLQ